MSSMFKQPRRLRRPLPRPGSICLPAVLMAALIVSDALEGRVGAAPDLDRHRDGVVRIVVVFRDSTTQQMGADTGSGFVLNSAGDVVTNHHVVADALEHGGEIRVLFGEHARKLADQLDRAIQPDSQRLFVDIISYLMPRLPAASVRWSDPTKDLAVLSTDGGGGRPMRLAPSALVKVGDPVWVQGYPGIGDFMGPSSFVTLKQNEGTISSKERNARKGVGVYLTSADIRSGNSGGPLVNDCGEVVGVTTFSIVDRGGGQHADYAIQVDALFDELGRLQVTFDRAAARCDPSASVAMPTITRRDPLQVGGIALAIVLGIAALGLATRRGRTVARQAKDAVSVRLRGRSTAETSGGSAVGSRARPAHPGAGASTAGVGVEAESPVAVIHGVSGAFADMELELGEEPVIFGRDPAVSHLVFPVDTTGISRRHCTLVFDRERQVVVLEDHYSTNGTFLASGQAVDPGASVALVSGDRFSLGGPDHLFEVRLESGV